MAEEIKLQWPQDAAPLTNEKVLNTTRVMAADSQNEDKMVSVTVDQLANKAAEKVQVDGGAIPAIQGGSTAATAVALPTLGDENRYFDASAGYWKYNNLVLLNPNGVEGIPVGSDGIVFWNGTTKLWSISKVQELPKGKDGANGKTTELFNPLKDGGYLAGDQTYFGGNKIYSALVNADMGESPATAPLKWSLIFNGGKEEVIVILYIGQSNCGGRVPISTATSTELLEKNNVMIWDDTSQSFQRLHIPVNNESGYQMYGAEIMYAQKAAELYPNQIIYLVKYHEGNTTLTYWMQGGAGRNLYEIAFMRPALFNLISDNKNVNLMIFYHQGEADNTSTNGGAIHLNRLRQFVTQWRAELGPDIPITFGEIYSSTNNINANFHTVASENKNIQVALMEGKSTLDGIHFNRESILSLGSQQFDLIPVRDGVRLGKNVPVINYYRIRNITASEINSGAFTLNIDLEYASINSGNTLIFIDNVQVGSESLTAFGTKIVKVNSLIPDGNSHSVKIQNSVSGVNNILNFTYPNIFEDKNVTIDFTSYSVPTIDASNFEAWTGVYEINSSPTSDKAIHMTSMSGGGHVNNMACVRLKEVANVQSMTIEYDFLFTNNQVTVVQGGILIRTIDDMSPQLKGYRLLMRYNRVFLYSNNGAGIVNLGDFTLPTQVINTWRRFRLSVDGYKFKVEYSINNGVDWNTAGETTLTGKLTFGQPTDTNLYYPKGEVLLAANGTDLAGAWFKNLKVTT